MKDLEGQINKIKEKLSRYAKEDQKIRNSFKNILIDIFPETNNPLRFIKEYYFKNDVIFIITTSKSFANEFFFKKQDLILKIEKQAKIRIKEVIIK